MLNNILRSIAYFRALDPLSRHCFGGKKYNEEMYLNLSNHRIVAKLNTTYMHALSQPSCKFNFSPVSDRGKRKYENYATTNTPD